MKKVTVRPGDKVTHRKITNSSDTYIVVSDHEFVENRPNVVHYEKAILVKNEQTNKYLQWKPSQHTLLNGETVTHYADAAATKDKVTARTGDTITWHGTPCKVLSRQEWENTSNGARSPLPPGGRAVAFKDDGGYATWNSVNHGQLLLDGQMVTEFVDETPIQIAERIFEKYDHDPATAPRPNDQEPDDDGMVIGWDGRKVWL